MDLERDNAVLRDQINILQLDVRSYFDMSFGQRSDKIVVAKSPTT